MSLIVVCHLLLPDDQISPQVVTVWDMVLLNYSYWVTWSDPQVAFLVLS